MTTQGGTGVAPTGDHDSPRADQPTPAAVSADAGSVSGRRGSPGSVRRRVPTDVPQATAHGAPSPADAVRTTASDGELTEALDRLRKALTGCRFGLGTRGAADARRLARRLTAQLDNYLVPRARRRGGPLLVVVCGPTGAGKSTLVNSLVRAPISQAGALRPTTRAPVLLVNPADASWFNRAELLPGFTRISGAPTEGNQLQVVAAPALPAGVALLDAPDIDSVVDANRTLATQLMDAADLWLFVTTAARYADDLPWRFLRSARDRSAGLALVLDRVPDRAGRIVRRHLGRLLAAEELSDAPVFDLPETTLDQQGLLPIDMVASLCEWFAELSASAPVRADVAEQTLGGALGTLPARGSVLASELTEQHQAANLLRDTVRDAHRAASSTMEDLVNDGPLLAGEPLAQWHELVSGGEVLRAVKARSGRLLDQLRVSLTGRALPGQRFVPAIRRTLTALLSDILAEAESHTVAGWRESPAGAALLSTVDDTEDLASDQEEAVAGWLERVTGMVADDAGQRTVARQTEYSTAAVRLMVLVAIVVVPSRKEATGAERAMLDTVLADPVVRRLAPRARQDLLDTFRRLVGAQRRRYDAIVNRAAEGTVTAGRLRAALRDVVAAGIGVRPTQPVTLPTVPPPADAGPPASAAHTSLPPAPEELFHPASPEDLATRSRAPDETTPDAREPDNRAPEAPAPTGRGAEGAVSEGDAPAGPALGDRDAEGSVPAASVTEGSAPGGRDAEGAVSGDDAPETSASESAERNPVRDEHDADGQPPDAMQQDHDAAPGVVAGHEEEHAAVEEPEDGAVDETAPPTMAGHDAEPATDTATPNGAGEPDDAVVPDAEAPNAAEASGGVEASEAARDGVMVGDTAGVGAVGDVADGDTVQDVVPTGSAADDETASAVGEPDGAEPADGADGAEPADRGSDGATDEAGSVGEDPEDGRDVGDAGSEPDGVGSGDAAGTVRAAGVRRSAGSERGDREGA